MYMMQSKINIVRKYITIVFIRIGLQRYNKNTFFRIFVVMDIESLRNYCLSLPSTTEDMAFGEEYLLIRVCGKIFACIGLERSDYFVLKCNPEYATELREKHQEIQPAWHWNKRYWNQLSLKGCLSNNLMKSLIIHSYCEVSKKLSKKVLKIHPEITEFTRNHQECAQ